VIYARFGKRLFDLAIALTALMVFLPFLVCIALFVNAKLGAPVLFRQLRPGLDGRPFMIFKFRTMTDDLDAHGNLLPDKDRLTRFGQLLRATSLDELPGLFNVVKGDMSIVGPRPLLMEYLSYYNQVQHRRHEVRPGLTGWAQVAGRNALCWEEKFRRDVWYADNLSFGLDLKIMVMTIWKVLKQEGINQPGQATIEKFRG
jgi:sugar transferase EpsL